MMNLSGKFIALRLTCLVSVVISTSTVMSQGKSSAIRLRQPVDTVGFASHALQMDSVMSRIISILVPYMPYEKMNQLSEQLATGIGKVLKAKGLKWGRDVAFVMSTDAVHYGDEDWGGSNYAFYGCDDKGFNAAKAHEMEIIDESLCGTMGQEKARKFIQFTLREEDYKAYKWTWCGRYSVPFGLLTIMKMQAAASGKLLQGIFIGYGTSLDEPRLKVSDLGMGTTANATMHHWVGYAGISYY